MLLKDHEQLQIVAEVTDGLEAVQKAAELQPDVILLDIGLPKLNGIDAAKEIHQVVPGTQIIFVTLNNDADLAKAALSNGAHGYVLKTHATRELRSAIEEVLRGKQYVSSGLSFPFETAPN
jgi:DNA-binding NarL/FixJ family response regulator